MGSTREQSLQANANLQSYILCWRWTMSAEHYLIQASVTHSPVEGVHCDAITLC